MNEKSAKLKRNFVSLERKIIILDRLKKGERITVVAKSVNLNEATIRTIKKNEEKIRDAVAAGSSKSIKNAARPRAPIMEKMENALSIWIEDCSQKNIPVDTKIIRQEALNIFNNLQSRGEPAGSTEFLASKGWLEKFKKRFCLNKGDCDSADEEAAKKYPEELEKIILEGGYTAHQVFNADETGLWWKRFPNRTSIAQQTKPSPGPKASEDRITMLFCSNASGDYITKPLLINKSENPRALKDVNKDTLPVIYKANKKGWVTKQIFSEWFSNYFAVEVEKYCKKQNLDFKALLLLDNAPEHPQDLSHPNIKVIFLPSNATSLLQPLDQGIIHTFKTHYIKKSVEWILDVTESNHISFMEAWKSYSIKQCVEFIDLSLRELKPTTLHRCWKKVWPSLFSTGSEDSNDYHILLEQVLTLAQSVKDDGFNDMTIQQLESLLEDEEIENTDLLELTMEANAEDSVSENETPKNKLTLPVLKEALHHADMLETILFSADGLEERRLKFKRELRNCIAPYKEIFKTMQGNLKQTKISQFFKMAENSGGPRPKKRRITLSSSRCEKD